MLADVFDALGSRRCYKEPWPEGQIRSFLEEQRGVKFDPRLVDLLFENWEEAQAIRAGLPDQ
jgi:response regulator RpfG family c-di-GMP phosphodiesterase